MYDLHYVLSKKVKIRMHGKCYAYLMVIALIEFNLRELLNSHFNILFN